jgi:hypothetical protein
MEETTLAVDRFDRAVRTSGPWSMWFRVWYRALRLVERPLVWLALRRGFGNLVVLRVAGRRTGRERNTPLGLLTVAGARYLGHPSGDTGWTLNLRAADRADISGANVGRATVRAMVLEKGAERDAVVRASFRQHPFPGNAMYRLAGSHVAETGVFFRLQDPDA